MWRALYWDPGSVRAAKIQISPARWPMKILIFVVLVNFLSLTQILSAKSTLTNPASKQDDWYVGSHVDGILLEAPTSHSLQYG